MFEQVSIGIIKMFMLPVLTSHSFPGQKKAVTAYGTAGAAPAAAEDDDDDEDLFGSDEDDDEAARIKEERLAAYAAKKAKSMLLSITISGLIFCIMKFEPISMV